MIDANENKNGTKNENSKGKQGKTKNPIFIAAALIALVCAVGIVLVVKHNVDKSQKPKMSDEYIDSFKNPDGEELKTGDICGDIVVTGENLQMTGNYENKTVLSYKYDGTGNTISVGMKNGPTGNGIILNLNCSDSIHAGYYIEPTTGSIQRSEEYASDLSYSDHKADKNFMITDRTYDKLVSAECHDAEHYGVCWLNKTFGNAELNRGDTVHIRAVNLDTGNLLCILRLTIEYKDDHFEISKLENADVHYTKELSDEERSKAIYTVTDFLQSLPEIGTGEPNVDYWDLFRNQAVVEKVKCPYFENLYNAERQPVHRGVFYHYDVYAVNIQVIGYGLTTVYVAPYMDAYGFPKSYIDEYDLRLTVIGYDAFHPESAASLDVDDSFWVRNDSL